ncbi:MAG: HspR protein [Actinobacteria bacterium]|nr:MAG: HspR protein [Actinomycetota bacterium]
MASATRKARSAQLTRRTPRLVAVEALARDAGVHPEIVLRFVQLGLLEPRGGTRVAPLFRAQDAFVVARAMRLRRDLGVNYAGAVLASELLARIEELEQRLRGGAPTQTQHEVITWTRTV